MAQMKERRGREDKERVERNEKWTEENKRSKKQADLLNQEQKKLEEIVSLLRPVDELYTQRQTLIEEVLEMELTKPKPYPLPPVPSLPLMEATGWMAVLKVTDDHTLRLQGKDKQTQVSYP